MRTLFLIIRTLFLLAIFGVFFTIPLSTAGMSLGLNQPFGGRILFSLSCSAACGQPGFKWIVVGMPTPGSFIKIPVASTVYEKKGLDIGHQVLGFTMPGFALTPCLKGAPPACVPVGFGVPIRGVGTN